MLWETFLESLRNFPLHSIIMLTSTAIVPDKFVTIFTKTWIQSFWFLSDMLMKYIEKLWKGLKFIFVLSVPNSHSQEEVKSFKLRQGVSWSRESFCYSPLYSTKCKWKSFFSVYCCCYITKLWSFVPRSLLLIITILKIYWLAHE